MKTKPRLTKSAALKRLAELDACEDAVAWCRSAKSVAAGWKTCRRGDWMLWLCGRLSGEPESESRRKLVLCACQCARLSLKYVLAGETRPLRCIETAERWASGEPGVSLEDVRAARRADAAADAAAGRSRTLAQCADIVREFYPVCPLASPES